MRVKVKAVQLVSTGLVLLFAVAILVASSVLVQAQSTRKAEVQEKIQQKRQEVLERQEARRELQGEKREEQRVAACERNRAKLVRSMERLTGQAERHLSVISAFQTKVEDFYASGQLTVENYEELHDAVVEAQGVASSNVEALETVEVDIDCNDSEIATVVGLYRVIANDTKNALKEYRRSLVDLISAMRAEAAETSDDTATENESEDENEQESESEETPEQENETESNSESENEQETEDSSNESESEERQ